MLNKAQLIGNLGQKPQLVTTNSGLSVTSLRVATSDRRKDKESDQWIEQVEWHSVVLFGKQAENASKYLDKGSRVFVEGRIQTRKWQDKEGKDRYSTEIVAKDVKYLSSKGSKSSDEQYDENYEEVPF